MTNHNNDFLFPWMCIILERLPDDILHSDSLIHLLPYLTCLGLMQNNWFVHFRNIELLHKKLVAEIPHFIQLLQSCEILSFFSLPKLRHLLLKRLHESIPIHIHESEITYDFEIQPLEIFSEQEVIQTIENTDVDSVSDIAVDDNVTKMLRIHLPAGNKARWTSTEMEVMDNVLTLNCQNTKLAYTEYLRLCKKVEIPDRSYASFKIKYFRIKAIQKYS